MKRCTKCGEDRPLSDFCKQSKNRDGLNYRCKTCRQAASRAYYAKNRDVIIARAAAWNREHPERRRMHRTSPEKRRATDRRQYAARRDYEQAYQRSWHANNPAASKVIKTRNRIRKAGQDGPVFTAQEWTDLCNEYDNRCCACRVDEPLVVDHVVPVIKNGPSTIDNIQPLCKMCNSRKKDKIIDYRRKATQ